MSKSKYDDSVLATKLDEVGDKFLKLFNSQATKVDFIKVDHPKASKCGTVACHGGWGLVILPAGLGILDGWRSYSVGADRISKHLGFWGTAAFESWAAVHPTIWGNGYGGCMFGGRGEWAFGKESGETCTLEDIGNHYKDVAGRLGHLVRWGTL